MPTVNFIPSEADLVEANWLWFRTELRRSENHLLFLCGGAIFGLVGWHIASDADFNRPLGLGAAVGLWIALVGFVLSILRFQLPKRTRQRFSQHRSLHGEVRLSWSEDELTFETADGHSRHSWGEFEKWAESSAVFIMFYTGQLFSFIPKRVLSTAECDEIRELLSRR